MLDITFRPITRDNWREALTLAVSPEQQRFVSDYEPVVLIGLAKAYVGSLGLSWIPYGIYVNEQMVGFIALAFRPQSEEEYWLFHFLIDQRYQQRGYGRSALNAFLNHIRESQPNCRSIALTVHPENIVAQHMYQKVGFVATGTEAFDEPLYRLNITQNPIT